MSTPEITLHGTRLSGHCHRAELLLLMLGLPYRYEESPASVRQTPAFAQLNPLQQVPVLQDGEITLCDSNAILVYLAKRYAAGSQWLPEEPLPAAQVQRWLSVAAGEVMHGPAVARMTVLWNYPADLARSHKIAERLLKFMDTHLEGRSFLAADHATIADLACYSYVAHAPEGRVSLAAYQSVQAWLRRVEALPNFQPMPVSQIPEAA